MFGETYRDTLDSFLDTFVKTAAPKKTREEMKETQKQELELWHAWNKSKKPENLHPLYESYKPLLVRTARKFQGVELPTSTINAEIDKHFVNAVKTFNPNRGTQLNTWVQTNLQKASRFIKTYQNFGKIPEGQISQIRRFEQAKEHLFTKTGFEPDTKTLADHLGWTPRRVQQLHRELSRRDLPASGFESDPAELLTPKELEAIKLMQYDLTPEERTVYEYTFGMNDKQRLQPGQIAKKTNIHPSKVSRIRNKLVDKLKEAMELV